MLQSSLAATGRQVQHALVTSERDEEELNKVRELLPAIGRGSSKDYEWTQGRLQINHDRVAVPLRALRNYQATMHGNLNVSALLLAHVVGDGILLNADGQPAKASDFPGVVRAGDSFSDVLSVQWHNSGAIVFSPGRLTWPLAPKEAHSFRRLCDALTMQQPGILRQQSQPEDMVLRPASLDLWRLTPASMGFNLVWSPVADVSIAVGRVHTTDEATTLARDVLTDHTTYFESHDWLDHPSSLWRGGPRVTSATAKEFLARAGNQKCKQEAAARAR